MDDMCKQHLITNNIFQMPELQICLSSTHKVGGTGFIITDREIDWLF
jgi:hypothetical protein